MLLESVLAGLAVMLVSFVGVVFSMNVFATWVHRNLTYLATFSGGVFIIVVYHLLKETLAETGSAPLALGAILLGAALMEAIHHLLPQDHHHHGTAHDHSHTPVDGRRVLISDALHNIGDGVLLVATFSVSWSVGLAAAIGIIVHELVQEISEFFVLKEAGYTTSQALFRNFLASATILVGVLVAFFLASAEEIAVLFAGLAAGGFITVVLRDLLPNTLSSIRKSGGTWKHCAAALLGILLMLWIQTTFSHEELTAGAETLVPSALA